MQLGPVTPFPKSFPDVSGLIESASYGLPNPSAHSRNPPPARLYSNRIMTTQSRSDAARTNGAKSRGPVTERSKANSSRNAIRHGLASSMSMKVLPGEQAHEFQFLLADIVDEHQPRTPTESRLTESMALAKWRQMRAWEMGDAALTQEILAQNKNHPETAAQPSAVRAFAAFREIADNGSVLVVMNRYEARYERLYERSLKLLLRLQDETKDESRKQHPAAIEITEGTQELVDSEHLAGEQEKSPEHDESTDLDNLDNNDLDKSDGRAGHVTPSRNLAAPEPYPEAPCPVPCKGNNPSGEAQIRRKTSPTGRKPARQSSRPRLAKRPRCARGCPGAPRNGCTGSGCRESASSPASRPLPHGGSVTA